MRLVANVLLFFASLVALIVLSAVLWHWRLMPDQPIIAQVKTVLMIVAPFPCFQLIKRTHYAVAGRVACVSLSIFSWPFVKLFEYL